MVTVAQNEDAALLRRIPMFADMGNPELSQLAAASERVAVPSGREIFHQGDQADATYIFVEGSADVIVDTPNGTLTVARLGKNDFVGEIAILCDVPRTATVKATTDLHALRLSKDLFLRLVADNPTIAVHIMRVLAQRLEATTGQLREVSARRQA
jgi:CRP-like cAMP-binding protein